jgi:hypothetical protein
MKNRAVQFLLGVLQQRLRHARSNC